MKTKIKKVILLILMLNMCLLYSQNFGNFSNIEDLFSLTKQEVEKEIKNNGYQFKEKDKLGITTYVKRVPGYTFAVNLLFGGTQLKMIGWDDTIMGGKFIVEDIGNDNCYKIDETKTDDYLGVITTVCESKGFQVMISNTLYNKRKGEIGFTIAKVSKKSEIQDEKESTQNTIELPFVGIKTFSFCEGNACESYIEINKNGNCKIESYGFDGTVTKEYNEKYSPIIWIYENQKKSYGYKILGNTIYQIGLNGKIKKDCFENQLCKSYLYYTTEDGEVKY